MLKRLELIGFKSFAEKTRFDFPAGITAIVGPNGSGKSNIVDAVRWILGEQSAKSLRGGEMSDVIFNGSSTRKSLGLAEVTMTFDNTRKSLNSDSEEVQITRRVYRDGTGEYLINNHLSRLKDIKDLFLGSGAGTNAYCIIEQGRVDALLQASTADRRTIFEEAAGISRFKAKKNETLRKLEHVDQNLEQLRLIISEVDKQYRKASIEANRAKKFVEHSEQLKHLRIGMGVREYQEQSQRVLQESTEITALRSGLTATQVEASEWEAEAYRLEQGIQKADREIQTLQNLLSSSRQQIATLDAEQQHEWTKCENLQEELSRTRQRRIELLFHLQLMDQSVEDAQVLVGEAEKSTLDHRASVQSQAHELMNLDDHLRTLQEQIRNDRIRQFDMVRQASMLQSQAESLKQQLERLKRDQEQRQRRREQKSLELHSLERVLSNLSQVDADLQQKLSSLRESLNERLSSRDTLGRLVEHLQQEQSNLNIKRSDLRGRIETLETLERSQEGLSTGVREVVGILNSETNQEQNHTNLSSVIMGLVADLLSVPRELAPLIDLALGETAQRFVIRNSARLDRLLTVREKPFSGRVSFLPYVPQEPLADGDETATADRWVTCEHSELAGLPRQLLGNVQIVDNLALARGLTRDKNDHHTRFVTRQGELLEPDGTLTVGSSRLEGGILSRKSELRDLRLQAKVTEKEYLATEKRLTDLRSRIDAMEDPIFALEQEMNLMTGQVGDLQSQIGQHQQHQLRIEDEISLFESELQILLQEVNTLQTHFGEAQQLAEQADSAAQSLKLRLEEIDREIRTIEQRRLRLQQEHLAGQVQLAQMEERQTALKDRHQQFLTERNRGHDEYARMLRHEKILHTRVMESELTMLRHSSESATHFLHKDQSEQEIRSYFGKRSSDRARRETLLEQLQNSRSASKDQLESLHHRELALRDLQNQLQVLVNRLKEEYQIDLVSFDDSTLSANPTSEYDFRSPELNVATVHQEIAELQKKIISLGRNVNLDSIQELTEVETRAKEMKSQHDDLTSSQNSLLEIINKINNDSRKLFAETYEQIRAEFQDLFRKLFGGGQADVILENPDDVLESGIEIMARPPGKELRSISLMSGGEKTLTAVALLLAIFRSKPSPFCLLDEVDAALDEANTSRLASVIREFLTTSQFIIITHKKRTMATADVLYGITMQESGVSKQVAVRFEDWPEEENKQAA